MGAFSGAKCFKCGKDIKENERVIVVSAACGRFDAGEDRVVVSDPYDNESSIFHEDCYKDFRGGPSVFERHGKEIELYQKVGGPVNGSILYAMAILSDVQEMAGDDVIVREVNEAKELLASVLDFLHKS